MVQHVLRCCLLIALPIGCAEIVHGQDTGTLRARFVFGGVAPEAEKMNVNIVQRDQLGHNANLNFFANNVFAGAVPPGGPQSIKIEKAEPAPIPIDCNVHAWMRAYLVVLDHRFVSVSDDQGNIEIKDLPAGNELVFRLYHESFRKALVELEMNGQKVTLDRNLIRLMIKPGMNDLGTIVIPAALLGL